jgi:hypothetical protein
MNAIERDIREMKATLATIVALLRKEGASGVPGMDEYVKAVSASVDGDPSLLRDYMAKGGRVYSDDDLARNGLIERIPDERRVYRRRPSERRSNSQ